MNTRDLLEQARASLDAHRLRASLAALGIVCGTASVVAALAITAGARRQALDQIGALGLDTVYVRAEAPPSEPGAAAARRGPVVPALLDADGLEVAARVAAVDGVALVRAATTEIRAGERVATAHIAGVSEDWQRIVNAGTPRGRWLQSGDWRSARRVAVIGAELAAELFADRDPIGEYLRAGEAWFRIAGVFERRARGGGGAGQSIDFGRAALVPLRAMDISRGRGDSTHHVSEIVFHVRAGMTPGAAAAAIDARLRDRYQGGGDFSVLVPRALLDARLRSQRATRALLFGIGGLALLISGVGIMNIMLASVVERTSEIGVRRAFGATRPQIVGQFLLESFLLSGAGALCGVPAGALLAWAVAVAGGWPIAIPAASIVLAIALATGVGLGSAILPARRAAALDPAAALRAE